MENNRSDSQPNIASSSATDENPRKQGAEPTAGDVKSSGKVWDTEAATDPSGRVGDVGGSGGTGGTHSMPYDVETASDAVAQQTNPDGVRK
jgi:hypothetical protein